MKSIIGQAVLLGLAGATAAVVGCSSSPSTTGKSSGPSNVSVGEAGGKVSGLLTLGNDTSIPSVNYVLQNGTSVVQSGVITTNNSAQVNFELGGIPAGSGYVITLSGTSADGGVSCLGTSQAFAVTARNTANVGVNLICTSGTTDAGQAIIIGAENFCGTWQSVSTAGPGLDAAPSNGSEVFADGTTPIVISATANGAATSDLVYTWSILSSTGAGVTLGASTGNGTTSDQISLVCNPSTVAGGAVIQLVVSDSADGGAVSCPGSLSTTTVPVTCDAVAGCGTLTKCGTGSTAVCADLTSNNANCGACGNACTGGTVCQNSACVCPTGQGLCGGACVPLNTASNCGACGVTCGGSTPSCNAAADGGAPTCGATVCTPSNSPQCLCNAFIATSEAGKTISAACTQTEVALFVKDTTGACLNCALAKSCIDDNIGTGDSAQECDDLASTTTAPGIASVIGATAVSECLATLTCEIGDNDPPTSAGTSPTNVGSTRTLANAYCGSATATTCQNGSPAGTCVNQIATGLPGVPAGSSTLSHIGDQTYPSGQAGTILACLLRSTGGQCGTCVN